jgi:hypothetical protein
LTVAWKRSGLLTLVLLAACSAPAPTAVSVPCDVVAELETLHAEIEAGDIEPQAIAERADAQRQRLEDIEPTDGIPALSHAAEGYMRGAMRAEALHDARTNLDRARKELGC